jgi:hypothetical protein
MGYPAHGPLRHGEAGFRLASGAKTSCILWLLSAALLWCGGLAAQTAGSDAAAARNRERACASLAREVPHADELRKVCEYAVTIPQRMPNFTCSQTTTRYFDKQPEQQPDDVITAVITYEDGTESYQDVRDHGRPVADSRLLGTGTWSTGQFAGDLRSIFDTSNKVDFQFVQERKTPDSPALVFAYTIERQEIPLWVLQAGGQQVAPPYHGQVWVEENSGNLLRLEVAATELPQSFAMRSAEIHVEYQNVRFGDGTSFVLPLKAVVNTARRDGGSDRNVLEFSHCHRFKGTARILPQSDGQASPPERQ